MTPGSLPSRRNPVPHKNNAFQKMPGKIQMSLESWRAVRLFLMFLDASFLTCKDADQPKTEQLLLA